MTTERDTLRDWHRLFGLLLTDFFTGSPFTVEVERDLSEQQQFLDVVILRRGRGRFRGRLPDGLDGLAQHNLITFKSHHEALDAWAMKELISHDVPYRKLVSPSPSNLLPDDHFRLYAVCARFPHNLSTQVPWQEVQAGVYDCRWGTDVVRVIVAGQLDREVHNAPLHLFSAAQELVDFGSSAYRVRSERTSLLLGQLFERFQGEGLTMSFTMDDFVREYLQVKFAQLTPDERRNMVQALPPDERRNMLQALPPDERRNMLQALPPDKRRELFQALPPDERRETLESLPLEERLAGLSAEQLREYLDRLTPDQPAEPRKPKRKK